MKYMFLPFKRYFDFSGRSRRMEFWVFNLFIFIVLVVLALVAASGFESTAILETEMGEAGEVSELGELEAVSAFMTNTFESLKPIFFLLILFVLATFIPSIAVGVRRLHDRNMSGWWYLLFFFGMVIPLIGPLITLAFIVIFLLPGTSGPNRFGDDPKQADFE